MLRSTSPDGNDILASPLTTATVALDTDCREAKRCIQRAAVLLGIEAEPGTGWGRGALVLAGRAREVASQSTQISHRGQTGLEYPSH
jgi:hypothetical protein